MSDMRLFLCKKRNHHSDEGDSPHIKTSRPDTDRQDSPGYIQHEQYYIMAMCVSMVADFTHLLLVALLAIGGVELNPGPKCHRTKLCGAPNLSETSSCVILPKFLAQPAFLMSDADIVVMQQEIVKCRQEILGKSEELCEQAKELSMKNKLLVEKEKRITQLLEMCENMRTTLLLQEAKIAQVEKPNATVLVRDNEDQETLELKCKEFEKEVKNLECKLAVLSEQCNSLMEEKDVISEKLSASENVVAVRLSLISSCQDGDWRVAVPLLAQYLSPGVLAHQQLCSVQGHTYCLAEAATQGYVDLLREFLVHGFPPDTVVSHDGTTMLHRAAWNGRTELIQLLLHYRAPVDSRDSVYSRTALMYAALGGHEKTLTYLLDSGAAINSVDSPGWSALHLAAMMGHGNVVWHLVCSGADIMLQSKNGQTAGDIARQYHKQQVVTLLSRFVESRMLTEP